MNEKDYMDCLVKYLKTAIELQDFLTTNGRKVNREFTVAEFDTLLAALGDYEDGINFLIEEWDKYNTNCKPRTAEEEDK